MAIPRLVPDQWVRDEGLDYSVVDTCGFETYPGSVRDYEPPEYCDNEVVEGEEFCSIHTYDSPIYGPYTACYEFDRDAA